jgi:hypothetical protein
MRVWSTLQFATPAGRGTDGSLLVRSGNQLVGPMLADPVTQELLARLLSSFGFATPRVRLEGEAPAPPVPPEAKARKAAPTEGSRPAEGEATAAAESGAEPAGKPAAPPPEAAPDTRTMGELFKDEPLLQKALDMFDGEVLP